MKFATPFVPAPFVHCAVAFAVLSLGRAWSADAVDLKVGDPAPAFHVQDDTGAVWKSTDHFGKKIVVVYFYPADFTGGCTKQACGFRDDMAKLSARTSKWSASAAIRSRLTNCSRNTTS